MQGGSVNGAKLPGTAAIWGLGGFGSAPVFGTVAEERND